MASNLSGFLSKYQGLAQTEREEPTKPTTALGGFLNKYRAGLPEEEAKPEDVFEGASVEGEAVPTLGATVGQLRTASSSAVGAAWESAKSNLVQSVMPRQAYAYTPGARALVADAGRQKEEARESLGTAVGERIKAAQMQLARDPGYWEQSLYDTVSSAESAVPLVAGVGAGFAFRSPQAGLLASALTAPIPAISQYSQAYVEAKQAGQDDESAHLYASKIAGSEYLFEALGPAKLAKTMMGSVGRQYVKELVSETATSITQTELGRAEGFDAPGSIGEYAESMKTLPVVVGVFGAAAAPGTMGRYKQEQDAKKPTAATTAVEIPKTGDPSVDAGIKLAEAALGAEFSTEVDVSEPFTQGFKKPKLGQLSNQPQATVTTGEGTLREQRGSKLGLDQNLYTNPVVVEAARRTAEIDKLALEKKQAEVDLAYTQRAETKATSPTQQELLTSSQKEALRKRGIVGPVVADEKVVAPESEGKLAKVTQIARELAARRAAIGTANVPKNVAVTTPEQPISPLKFKPKRGKTSKVGTFTQADNLLKQETVGAPVQPIPTSFKPGVPTSEVLLDAKGKPLPKTPLPPKAATVEAPVEEVSIDDLITNDPQKRHSIAELDQEVSKRNQDPETTFPVQKPSQVLRTFVTDESDFGKLGREAKANGALVLQAKDDAPENMRGIQAYLTLKSGKPVVHINVDNVGKADTIERLVGHEVTHGALQYEAPELAKELADKARVIATENPDGEIAKALKGVRKDYASRIPEEDGPVKQWAEDVEFLPGIVERYLKMKADKTPMGRFKTVMREFGIKVRQALRKMGPMGKRIADRYGETDLMKLVHDTVLAKAGDFAKGKSTPTRGRNFLQATLGPYAKKGTVKGSSDPQARQRGATEDDALYDRKLEPGTIVEFQRGFDPNIYLAEVVEHSTLDVKGRKVNQHKVRILSKTGVSDTFIEERFDVYEGPDKRGTTKTILPSNIVRIHQKLEEDPESAQKSDEDTLVKTKKTEDYRSGDNVVERVIMQAFSNSQGRPEEVNAIMERKDSEFAASSAKVRMIVNQLQTLMTKAGITSDQLSDPEVLAKHPKIAQRLRVFDAEVRKLSLQIADLLENHGGVLSERDKAIIQRIRNNLDYRTRTFKLFAPFGYGKKFAKGRWNLYLKNKDKDPNTLTGAAKEAVDAVLGFKEYVYQRFMEFAKPTNQMTESELKTRYEFWSTKSADEIPVDQLRSEVEKLRAEFSKAGKDVIDEATDLIAQEALDLTATAADTIKYFKPSSLLDNTIVTPMTDVPPAVRKLWGENLDPLTNYHETLFRQYRFISEFTALLQIKQLGEGKWLFKQGWDINNPNFDKTKYNTKLLGSSFGPLEGMTTTRFVHDALVEFTKAGKTLEASLPGQGLTGSWLSNIANKGLEYWKAGARGAKLMLIIPRLMGYAYNFASSHLMHIATGNFAFTGYKRGIKSGLNLINLAAHDTVSKETIEILRAGMTDSALVGEYQKAEAEKAIREIFRRELKENPKEYKGLIARYFEIFKGKPDEILDRMVEMKLIMIDAFAFMDMHAKLANYFYEKGFVQKYAELRGQKMSDEQAEIKAAERAKGANYSYNKVWPLFKFVEEVGATAFFKYITESFRVLWNNMMLGAYDVKEGYKEGGKAGQYRALHGTKRLAGVAAATMGHKYLLTGLAKLLAYGLSAMGLGDDDEDNEDKLSVIQEGLTDKDRNGILVPTSTKDGTYVFTDMGRFDIFDPFNKLHRTFLAKAADGNYEEAFKELGTELGQMVMTNPILRYATEQAGSDKKPSLFYTAPNSYNAMRDTLGLPGELFDELLKLGVVALPPAKDFMEAYDQTKQNVMSEPEIIADTLGARIIVFDPKKEVGLRFKLSYDAALGDARSTLTGALETGKKLPDKKLEELYVDTLKKESDEFAKMYKLIVAARAAGASRSSILLQLKQAGASEMQRASLISGRFMPAAMGDEFMESIKQRLIDAAGTKATLREKNQIARGVVETKQRLLKLRAKYRKYIQAEAN